MAGKIYQWVGRQPVRAEEIDGHRAAIGAEGVEFGLVDPFHVLAGNHVRTSSRSAGSVQKDAQTSPFL
jgi:hypothetical protein